MNVRSSSRSGVTSGQSLLDTLTHGGRSLPSDTTKYSVLHGMHFPGQAPADRNAGDHPPGNALRKPGSPKSVRQHSSPIVPLESVWWTMGDERCQSTYDWWWGPSEITVCGGTCHCKKI